jgi:hypothetical protein
MRRARSTAMLWKPNSPTTRKKAPAARRGGAAPAWQGRLDRGIYNRADYWAERVRLMQHWPDRLDSLRDDAPAISLRRSAA